MSCCPLSSMCAISENDCSALCFTYHESWMYSKLARIAEALGERRTGRDDRTPIDRLQGA